MRCFAAGIEHFAPECEAVSRRALSGGLHGLSGTELIHSNCVQHHSNTGSTGAGYQDKALCQCLVSSLLTCAVPRARRFFQPARACRFCSHAKRLNPAGMDRFEIQTVVIGAGVVGLACARALAMAGHDVMVLEKNAVYGEETSARNSEVIHAGIYYDAGSLKAQWCVAGRRALYAYADARGVPHRKCGKLIVAADDAERPMLETIAAKAGANGVEGLRLLSRAETQALEPDLDVAGALLSPETGIIDSHALMLAYLGEAEAHGAQLVTGAPVLRGDRRGDGGIDLVVGGDEPLMLSARHVVNAAGLWAQSVASGLTGIDAPPPLALVKGNYFSLTCRAPFRHLIYPAPSGGGLGVHLTLDMQGRAKFGPDVEWLETQDPARIDYRVDPARGADFYGAIRRYWPALPDNTLAADYSGVRPKIAGAPYPDYVLDSRVSGHVMLYGIESPGLTSSLAIADAVVAALG